MIDDPDKTIDMLPKIDDIAPRRKGLGVTQARLAELAGLSRSMIAKIETQPVGISYDAAKRIFHALDRLEAERRGADLLRNVTVGQIKADAVQFVLSSTSVQEVWGKMVETDFSQFPVRDGGRIVGSVTERNVNRALMEGNPEEVRGLPVREIMETAFPTVEEGMPVAAVVPLLQHTQAVLVIDGGDISGIVTNSDVGRIFRLVEG